MIFDYELQKYYKDIFEEINESINDYETLKIGIEIVKLATDRLSGDLDNINIKKEYDKLLSILKELDEIKNNYV